MKEEIQLMAMYFNCLTRRKEVILDKNNLLVLKNILSNTHINKEKLK